MNRKIIAILIALMGFVHIGATFSPLISGKLTVLDTSMGYQLSIQLFDTKSYNQDCRIIASY